MGQSFWKDYSHEYNYIRRLNRCICKNVIHAYDMLGYTNEYKSKDGSGWKTKSGFRMALEYCDHGTVRDVTNFYTAYGYIYLFDTMK